MNKNFKQLKVNFLIILVKYQYQLMSELQELQTVMAPLMTKISSVIPQQQFPGMGMGNGGAGGMELSQ